MYVVFGLLTIKCFPHRAPAFRSAPLHLHCLLHCHRFGQYYHNFQDLSNSFARHITHRHIVYNSSDKLGGRVCGSCVVAGLDLNNPVYSHSLATNCSGRSEAHIHCFGALGSPEMAFNLGDKFEIHSLQLDVREIQKQLDVLFGGIPAQFVKPSPSWKYPTLRASDLNVTDVIQCNQFEEGSPEASKNLHFLLLELCVDRLLAAVQVSAGVVEKILDENTRLGTIFDVSNKLSIGPIAKAFGKLVEIAISASYERKADLLRKRRDFACAADSEEMKTRNPCKSCQELGNDLQMFIEVLTRCFPSHIPLASNKNVDEIPNSDELTENFISEVCGFCNSIDELRKLTTVKFTEAVKLQTRIIAEREISEAMKPHIVLLEKQVFENEATCKTLLHLKGDQELQLHQLNMDGSFLEQERLQYETQNGELEKELRERIAELESSTTEYFDLTAEREKRERQKNEVRLQRASESAALQSALKQAEVALQKCEGFGNYQNRRVRRFYVFVRSLI